MRGALGILVLCGAIGSLLYVLAAGDAPDAAPALAPLAAEGMGPTLRGSPKTRPLSEAEDQEAKAAAALHRALLPMDRAARIAHLRAYLEQQAQDPPTLPFSPELAALLIALFRESPGHDWETGTWLQACGPRMAPYLNEILASGVATPQSEQLLGILALWHLQDRACPLPDLLPYLESDRSLTRHLALRILRAGVPYETKLADRLVEMFRARPQFDPRGPGAALARMGPEGVARLLAFAGEAEAESERVAVLQILARSTPECLRPHLPTLLAWMADPGVPAYTRAAAVYALQGMWGECETCLPTLCALLQDESYEFITPCLSIFSAMNTQAAPAVVDLVPWLESDDPRIADDTARVLGQIGARADLVVPALSDLVLRAGSDMGARALGAYGAAALPHARRVLAEGDEYARYAILWTFAGLGDEAASMVPTLLPLLDGDDEDIALRTIGTLGYIGPKAAAAVPAIMKRALEGDARLPAKDAAATLARLGPRAEEALLAALRATDTRTVRRAAEMLTHFHLRSAFAIDELARLTRSGDSAGRATAYQAIGAAAYAPVLAMDGSPHAVPPGVVARVRAELERGRSDKDPAVRAAAEQALQQVLAFQQMLAFSDRR